MSAHMVWVFILSVLLWNHSVYSFHSQSDATTCDTPNNAARIDCHPDSNPSQNRCLQRGCCWRKPSMEGDSTVNVPLCYYPKGYNAYEVISVTPTLHGYVSILEKFNTLKQWPHDIVHLKLVMEQFGSLMRVKFLDLNNSRWQVPVPIHWPPTGKEGKKIESSWDTIFPLEGQNFRGFRLHEQNRLAQSNQLQMFTDSFHEIDLPLIFTDQFIQFSVYVGDFFNIYGIGEQRHAFLHNASRDWSVIGLYSRDQSVTPNVNLYSVQNFFVGISEKTGAAFGMFVLNSNAQEVVLQPMPAVTYRFIGGIIDTIFITGKTPSEVVSQYWSLLGSPMLPPYWSLGFHLCRWGYKDVNDVKAVVDRNRKALIPHDAQWTDIDYMNKYLDWTLDPVNFGNMGDLVKQLQSEYGMHYVPIVDPGISNTQPSGSYPPYDKGLAMGLFIRKHNSTSPLVGSVWPGTSVFPDFSHPDIADWWYVTGIKSFHDQVPFDGLWLDMNEPSNFVDGSMDGCLQGNLMDRPPYLPLLADDSLQAKTLCPSAETYLGPMYNVHNIYGYLESLATNTGLKRLNSNKRIFLLTRSTYTGSGVIAYHWTGDNFAKWEDLAASVVQLLNFNLFGIPMVGVDVCGFMGDSEEELCTRWVQLGSFYPFMRNHNNFGDMNQDPAAWDLITQARMRESLRVRYSLLIYLYTLLFEASRNHEPVFRPLWMDFPNDNATLTIENQFMFGHGIMVAPVLQASIEKRVIYFPANSWCSLHNMSRFVRPTAIHKNTKVTIENIPVYIRGGVIIPFQGLDFNFVNKTFIHQNPNATLTSQYRKLSLTLYACLGIHGDAAGMLIWDDGVTLDALTQGIYSQFTFRVQGDQNQFTWHVDHAEYLSEPIKVASLHIFSLIHCPSKVSVCGMNWVKFTCHENSILSVFQLEKLNWWDSIVIKWD